MRQDDLLAWFEKEGIFIDTIEPGDNNNYTYYYNKAHPNNVKMIARADQDELFVCEIELGDSDFYWHLLLD